MELLEVNDISKVYKGGTKALSNIGFSVKKGEFVSVIGPSGAGKSTLLRCINRLSDATHGSITFDETKIQDLNRKGLRELRTKIGMIFQNYNLVERLSVIENVLHGRLGYKSVIAGVIGIYTEDEKQQAFRIIEKLGLQNEAYKRCDELSGGQKQRVGIARALIQNPKLMLCDEPIASLDPNSSKIIMDQLKNINKEMGLTCILNLHQVDVAMKYSDKIIGINGGRIIFNGRPSELTKKKIHQIYKTDQVSIIAD
ncbi:phosphonate ABC transporter ATP-binding protein [Clostridium saccharobutylicum]|uniref:Phosphate-import ATP-binding protein PhnC n=1 Tax=Clostridium saccharobutylicum TaxID=169679 RepID=A0A1S8N2P9_CLOSA|nr:phosphonate ABC transporter ATP-binding protein [Clostridium saccharobutylicum]OOM10662.1 phosphate-import ATP-binding protein PhnC [Clostridium saccharobutylicum]